MSLKDKDLIETIRVLGGYIKEVKKNASDMSNGEFNAHLDKMIELADDALVEVTK